VGSQSTEGPLNICLSKKQGQSTALSLQPKHPPNLPSESAEHSTAIFYPTTGLSLLLTQ